MKFSILVSDMRYLDWMRLEFTGDRTECTLVDFKDRASKFSTLKTALTALEKSKRRWPTATCEIVVVFPK